MRFAAELCWPYHPREKGAVENLVGWVKGSFFKVRRFANREDLERQLLEWLTETNETRPSRATGVVPMLRLVEERQRLRPLSFKPSEYALRFPAFVGPTGFVEHHGYRYQMPSEAIGLAGTIHLYLDRVRIVAGRHVAEHPHIPAIGTVSYTEKDRAKALAMVSGDRARRYTQRQQLLELGAGAEAYLTEIVHRHPRTWRGDVEALHALLVSAGGVRLLAAIGQASSKKLFGAQDVTTVLKETA